MSASDPAAIADEFNTEGVEDALDVIDEPIQRFSLGEVTLELTVLTTTSLLFVFVPFGETVPDFVNDL